MVDDASFLISEAKRNLSAISFNVMAPNNDLEGVFNFNFQEVHGCNTNIVPISFQVGKSSLCRFELLMI